MGVTGYSQNPIKSAARNPARWSRRRDARPQEILDAALAVFAEKGFSGARTEDIAQRAGVTKGTLYLYFENKEAIFKSLVQESLAGHVFDLATQAREFEGSSADILRLVIRGLGHFARSSDRATLPRLMLAEIGNFPELAHFYKKEVIDRGLGVFEAIIRRGIERGEFRDANPKHTARLMMVPITFTAIWRTSFGRLDSEPYNYEEMLETHLNLMLRGLAAGNG
jgi:AcrR family transcriptional regulator